MTDDEALALAPALREFLDAVSERDEEVVEACWMHTAPKALAVLAAGRANDLMNERTVILNENQRFAEGMRRAAEERSRLRARVAELTERNRAQYAKLQTFRARLEALGERVQ